jgi:hypothetical protein
MGIDTGLGTFLVLKPVATFGALERETGIEPVSLAWKAKVLPLNYSREGAIGSQSFRLVEEAGFEPA